MNIGGTTYIFLDMFVHVRMKYMKRPQTEVNKEKHLKQQIQQIQKSINIPFLKGPEGTNYLEARLEKASDSTRVSRLRMYRDMSTQTEDWDGT